MASKQVLDEAKVADAVVEALRTHAAEVARRRAEQYKAAGAKHAPDAAAIEAALRADAATLAMRRDALRKANAALEAELGDDAAVLVERDRAAEAVRTALVEFRGSVQTNCGDTAVTEVGFVGNTPRDPVALEELGATVLARVAKSPPKSSRRGVRFDAKAALEGFDVEVAALAKANADVRREKREEQAARTHRNDAWKRFDRELSTAVARLAAELRAVELDELAARIVPATGGGSTASDGDDSATPPAPPR